MMADRQPPTIRTDYWAKPIPLRQFDWTAVDDDTYDGAPDSHCPIGYGATEQDAIDDLLIQIDEREAEGEAANAEPGRRALKIK